MHMGFNAALSMFEVHLPYDDIHVNSFKVLDKWIHFIGNENLEYDSTITYASREKNKFVSYLLVGDKIKGFVLYGFKNLQVYLKESLKMNMVPTLKHLINNKNVTHLQIVQEVMKKTDMIECYRHKAISECSRINTYNYEQEDQKITHDIMKRSLTAYNAYKDHLDKVHKKDLKDKEEKMKLEIEKEKQRQIELDIQMKLNKDLNRERDLSKH